MNAILNPGDVAGGHRRWLSEANHPWAAGPGAATASEQAARPVASLRLGDVYLLRIAVQSSEPPWLRPTVAALQQVGSLAPGWDSYGARTVAPAAMLTVLGLLAEVMPPDAPAPQVVPTAEGGIQLEWHDQGIDLEVITRSDGAVVVLFDDLASEVEWEETYPGARAGLMEALQRLSRGRA